MKMKPFHARFGSMALVGLFALMQIAARSDEPAPSLKITVKNDHATWIAAKTNYPKVPYVFETLTVVLRNSSQNPLNYTLYETLRPVIRTAEGKLIDFGDCGADHYRQADKHDFFLLAPGQSSVFALRIGIFRNAGKNELWYEHPSGFDTSCALPDGNYEIGVRYSLDQKFLDRINSITKEPYSKLVEEPYPVWLGTIMSDFTPVKIIGKD